MCRVTVEGYARRVWRVLISVLEQILDLGNKKTTSIIEFCKPAKREVYHPRTNVAYLRLALEPRRPLPLLAVCGVVWWSYSITNSK